MFHHILYVRAFASSIGLGLLCIPPYALCFISSRSVSSLNRYDRSTGRIADAFITVILGRICLSSISSYPSEKVPTQRHKRVRSFSKIRNAMGYTLHEFEIERSQRSTWTIGKHGELKEQRMAQRARVRGLLAEVRSTSGNKRLEFLNRAIIAANKFRRCLVMRTRPEKLTRSDFAGQPTILEVYKEQLELIASTLSKMVGRRLDMCVLMHPNVVDRFSLC